MSNFLGNKPVVFFLGAGFNRDAASEAGKILPLNCGRPAQYPLASDLLRICFNLDSLPPDKSIEDLFQDKINEKDQKPLIALCNELMEVDYNITPHLWYGGSHENNVYVKFLRDFSREPLLTFNYDSLPELLLLKERSWCPLDGYGVPVQANKKSIRKGKQPVEKSLRPILHLHGSLCVYSIDFYIEPESGMLKFDRPPEFKFDPIYIGKCFYPFEQSNKSVSYDFRLDHRVIAPVPNKAEGLKGDFIKAVYKKAVEFLSAAGQIVSIGYSFNLHDRSSYTKLLAAACGKPFLLVSPDAESTIKQLSIEFPDIQWIAQSLSFKEWVKEDYPGVFR